MIFLGRYVSFYRAVAATDRGNFTLATVACIALTSCGTSVQGTAVGNSQPGAGAGPSQQSPLIRPTLPHQQLNPPTRPSVHKDPKAPTPKAVRWDRSLRP